MRWHKRGIVYAPDHRLPWAVSHAMTPTPFRLNPEIIRVYATFLDREGVGRPGYVDLLASDPTRILDVSAQPLLEIGEPGTFDEAGLVVSSVIRDQAGRVLLYYVGFETGVRIRYRLLTGLAISEDGGTTFARFRQTPLLERSSAELYFRCGPFCLAEESTYRLWYVAGSRWTNQDAAGGKALPVYDIRYLESDNAMSWGEEGEVQLETNGPDEHGLGRPYVLRRSDGLYRLFYSIRRRSLGAYRLGYAESTDGRTWSRMDDRLNLDVTPGSFDSDAIMYAAPIEVDGRLYVFYNGNDFGRAGFALAELEAD